MFKFVLSFVQLYFLIYPSTMIIVDLNLSQYPKTVEEY